MRQLNVMLIDIWNLPALERVGLTLVSTEEPGKPTQAEVTSNNSQTVYRFNLMGTFAFDWNREVRHLKTWNHLKYDSATRRVVSNQTLSSHPPGQHVLHASGFFG